MKRWIKIGFVLLIFPGWLMAQGGEASFIHLSVENDLFIFKGNTTDRYKARLF